MSVILKYSASVYQAKITKFESLNSQLEAHLETLEGLKNQIPNFWEGEQTGRFIESISKAIVKVRKASDNVAGLRRIFQETVDEQTRMNTAIDDVVENVDKSIDRTIEVAGVAAKFIV